MNIHKNARLTPKGREVLVRRLMRANVPPMLPAPLGVSLRTVYK